MLNPDSLVRDNITRLVPYSSARKEFGGSAEIFLDANENSFGSPISRDYSRYPDPLQKKIKEILAEWYSVGLDEIFIGNGSDEAIDLVYRIFCEPGRDEVIICPPTYGMYEVSANINDVKVRRVCLTPDFQLDCRAILNAVNENSKLIFFCSPNNPTGNLLDRDTILKVTRRFRGIVVVDEAYIHFSGGQSLVSEIDNFPNLVVLQTFSKAWGLAGLRVGLAFGSEKIIGYFNKVKPPYNVSQIAQEYILAAFAEKGKVDLTVSRIVEERKSLVDKLRQFSFVQEVFPSDANFLLVKTADANVVYDHLMNDGIVVRNRSNVELCAGCLRITIGTPEEDRALLRSLENYEKGPIY